MGSQVSSSSKIRVSVVGATGYTGAELLRLLAQHPQVELARVTSRADAGKPVAESWPHLRGKVNLNYSAPDMADIAQASDVVFFATPHTVAMSMTPSLLDAGCKVIDLSADFRIKDVAVWEKWYGVEHSCPDYIAQAVYGLPELNREAIKSANLIACPGCYPTATELALIPLLEKDLIETEIIVNAASGVSGAGRQAKVGSLFAELSDNFKPYGVAGHRHLPEIAATLNSVASEALNITFVPHLLPLIRGILSTIYCIPKQDGVDWQAVFEARYADEPFVDVLAAGDYPETRSVKGTNVCKISVQYIEHSGRLCVMSAEDNLTKGAAGQAVQAMNIMYQLPEITGLEQLALLP